jgi:ferredoxin
MAKVICNNQSFKQDDDDTLVMTSVKAGIPISCLSGECGSCKIKVLSGAENLFDKTEEEERFNLASDERLSCQTKIKEGEVTITF